MRKLTLAITLACSVFATLSVRAQVPDPNHTVIRFDVLTGGTNFGSFDIELFDQEKPETVKNFLLYVNSGAYSNLVLHRLETSFVVQAGHIRVDDPVSTNLFTSFPAQTNFGRVTNEYSVGPVLSNVFGTIAMARVPGQTNSATTDWFINLTNNFFLDTVDGGFTVFGRVVNTADDRTGTNLLHQFNTFVLGNNIRSANPGESLSRLPVSTNRPGSPIYADLFTVVPSFVQGGIPSDDIAPTLAITSPAESFLTTTNSIVTIAGTASDNAAVVRVLYDSDSGKSLFANGTNNWSVELPLLYGTNHFSAWSIDSSGNFSPTLERVIVREEVPADPSHTIVRFDISTNGAHFGTLDIELYDDVKPETVRNFLMYVYSGGYSNLALAQLLPGQVLQGGHVQLNDTNPELGFATYDITPNFGLVPNEYDVGLQLANEFGTIATAAIPGKGNTTSNEWQINLTNNPSFNTNTGGATVFGRVVNSVDAQSGLNLLQLFNDYQYGVNLRGLTLESEPFSIPVTRYDPANVPKRKEMYFVNASVIQHARPNNHIAPILQVNDPAQTDIIPTTNATITLTGTASDDDAVARVIYDSPSGVSLFANGKENWNVEVSLKGGTNQITVRALDYFGNVSAPVKRTVFRTLELPLNLNQQGKGKLSGVTNGQSLLAGLKYTVSAKPAARQYFLGWQENGNFVSGERSYAFTMQEDLTNLTAVFSRSLLGISNGVYKGLFIAETNGPLLSAGSVTISVAPNGSYVGHLAPIGANYTIRGKFDANGETVISGQRNLDVLLLFLKFFPPESVFGDYKDGNHSHSSVALWHKPKFTAANPCPQAGFYTFLISPTLDTQTEVVQGYGFGYVTVDALGRIRMTGTLGDGTAIRQKSNLLASDVWPVYAAAKMGREVILGVAGFTTNHLFSAAAQWFSPDFPGKTNQNVRIDGSPYVRPSDGMPLFNWTLGVISLSGGGMPAALFADVELNADGSFTVPNNPNNIQINAPDGNGIISGSFIDPVTSALTPLQGTVLQSSNMAAGFFPGSSGTGAFVIRAR